MPRMFLAMRWTYTLFALCCFCVLPASANAAEPADVARSLFDGTSLKGWSGDETFWRVEEGTLVAESTAENPCKKNTFLVWQGGDVDDFELTLQFKIEGSPSANSGIQFRSQIAEDGHVVGYQADIDKAGNWLGSLYDEHGRKMLATRGESTTIDNAGQLSKQQLGSRDELWKLVKIEDWNEYKIVARGPQLELFINGKLFSRVIDHDAKDAERHGVLALQLHSGPAMKIAFKNIQLKRLPLTEGKKVVFVAGPASHGWFSHEHNAGCQLLAESLRQSDAADELLVAVYKNGWPADPTAFDNADTVIFYCDGQGRHVVMPHLQEFDQVMKRGVGLVCIHYAVEVTKEKGHEEFLDWLGGTFEIHYSVNPHWTANFDALPEHAITSGVESFRINDEWYYHMRFRPEMEGVTPILSDLPPRESLSRKDGHHSNNPFVRESVLVKKEPQHVAWAYDRSNGGRSFGFTGGHFHKNWQHDQFRKIVLNAIAWTAGAEVASHGVNSPTPSVEQMEANQDESRPGNWKYPTTQKKKQPLKVMTVAKTEPVKNSRKLEDATAQLQTHPELETTLFAGEPLLLSPANMDIDAQGRIWVSEVVNYRHFRNKQNPPRKEGDRILVLEDTNQDGKADKTYTFYQDPSIDSAHGICVLGNRVLVSALDSVYVLYDDNNDLKADRKEVLFTGISGSQHDHGIHAFVFGPDGKLYFNFGNEGKQLKDKNGKPLVDLMGNEINNSRNPYQEGMVFRCDLDGSNIETLGWNFRNNWEVCVDSFGVMWQSDNDDDGNKGTRINYVMPYGNYGYKDEITGAGWRDPRTNWEAEIPLRHWHLNDPGVMPNLVQTGAGSPTGILCYEGDLLPEIFHGQPIHCDAGPNIVRAYPTKVDGAGYTAEIVNIVEGKHDQWFRPSDVTVAPDGSLFIADWYDPGVGGHAMGDIHKGRVFRVAPPNSPYKFEACDVSTVEGAVKALLSPNQARRFLGYQALKDFGEKATPALEQVWKTGKPFEQARAAWLLGDISRARNVRTDFLSQILSHESDQLRATGIRMACELVRKDPAILEDINPLLDVNDASPAVRRELLIGLTENPDIEYWSDHWVQLAIQYDGKDRWYLEALGIAARPHWDDVLKPILATSDNWKTSKALRDIVWRSRGKQTPALLMELISDPKTPSEEIARYFRALDFQSSVPEKGLIELITTTNPSGGAREQQIISESIARLNSKAGGNEQLQATLKKMIDSNPLSPITLSIIDQFQLSDQNETLLAIATQAENPQLGADAVRLMIKQKQWKLMTQALAGEDVKKAVALATSMKLAGENGTAGPLEATLKQEEIDSSVKREVVRAMASSRQGSVKLMGYAKSKSVDSAVKATLASVLHASGYRDVQALAKDLFPLPPSKEASPLPPISELAKRNGNVSKGRTVYFSVGTCAKCHVVQGVGKEIGPNLSEIGKKLSTEAMYEAILYPSAGVSHNYESYSVVTDSGNLYTGLLVSQTEEQVVLKDAEGIERTIDQEEIIEMVKQEISLMPADLQKLMTAQELVDLVSYLKTLKP